MSNKTLYTANNATHAHAANNATRVDNSSYPINKKGSTLVAVLVAMVFLGIVSTALISNSGSQKLASMGYGNVMTMESTVKSGMIATEAYFKNATDGDIANILQGFVDAENANSPNYTKPIFPANNTNNRAKQSFTDAGDQFFRSEMTDFNTTSKNARFKITSGKNANGRDLKNATAFYTFENVSITNPGSYESDNAIYMAGELRNGDNGMYVSKGKATFEKHVKLQNKNIKIEEGAYFGGGIDVPGGHTAIFNKEVYIKGHETDANQVQFHGQAIFEKDAYIDGAITMMGPGTVFEGKVHIHNTGNTNWLQNINGATIFKDNASIRGGFDQTSDIETEGNLYLNGAWHSNNSIIGRTGRNIYFDNNKINLNQTEINNKIRNFSNRYDNYTGNTVVVDRTDIIAKTKGTDSQLDLNLMTATPINGSAITTDGNFDLAKLKNAYNNANSSNLHNGHLVVEVTNTINFTKGDPPNIFDGKVIFLVKDHGVLRGEHFIQSEKTTASTLVHVSGSGQLAEFGTTGTFRGLIYIDKENTRDHSFAWGYKSQIIGAIHNFSNGAVAWYSRNCPRNPPPPEGCDGFDDKDPVKIEFSKDVLGNFGSLVPCTTPPCAQPTVTISDFKMAPIGYYFH